MREPDARFLQLLPHDWNIRRNIGRVDLHLPRWGIAGRALSNAVFRLRLFRDGEGLIRPVHRRRMSPALNSRRRDRFQQLSGRFTRVFPVSACVRRAQLRISGETRDSRARSETAHDAIKCRP